MTLFKTRMLFAYLCSFINISIFTNGDLRNIVWNLSIQSILL